METSSLTDSDEVVFLGELPLKHWKHPLTLSQMVSLIDFELVVYVWYIQPVQIKIPID